jgi:hypothetical protein
MARVHPRRDTPTAEPTTLQEITRRYYACAVQLAKAMGLPLTEQFIRDHRESISSCFIESGRAGVRLPAAVALPSLLVDAPVASTNGSISTIVESSPDGSVAEMSDTSAVRLPQDQTPLPITVPRGLPCAGQTITALKPAQLRMLLSKVDQLAAEQGRQWQPLLEALAAERAARLQAGQRPKLITVEGDGHGP